MQKKIISALIIISVIFTVFGYKQLDDKLRTRKVVLVIKRSYYESEFWSHLVAGAMEAAKEFNIDLSIRYPLDETDIIGQQNILDEVIKNRPDALVFAPIDKKNFNKQILTIQKNGTKVITVDSKVDSELGIDFVGTQNKKAGKELGIFIKNYISSSSRIGLVGHVKSSTSFIDRKEGLLEGLGKQNANIVSIKNTDSTKRGANLATKEMLKDHPQINILVATNEDSALGMYQAISQLGIKKDIAMFGFDNSKEEARLVEKGVFKGILVQNPFIMGYFAIKNSKEMILGKKGDYNYDTGTSLITIENIYDINSQKMIFPIS